jgi:hypothetical protein
MEEFSKLKRWMKIKDNIAVYDRPERGLYSTKPIKAHDVVVRVRAEFLMEYSFIQSVHDVEGLEQIHSLVAFYLLLCSRDPNSLWTPFLNTFPTDASEFPMFWSRKDMKVVAQTSLVGPHYDSYLDTIESDALILYTYATDHQLLEFDDFDEFRNIYLKNRLMVGSRLFGYTRDGIPQSAMVPYVDMVNHSFDPNTMWCFDDRSDSFILVAIRDIPANSEILDSYGDQPNVDLLLYYGFTLPDNPFITLRLSLNGCNLVLTQSSDLSQLGSVDEGDAAFDVSAIAQILSEKLRSHEAIIATVSSSNLPNIFNIIFDEVKLIRLLLKTIPKV